MALKFDFNKLRTAVKGFLTGTDATGGSLAAGEEAFQQSELMNIEDPDSFRSGCIIGSGMGGLPGIEDTSLSFNKGKKISPFFITGNCHKEMARCHMIVFIQIIYCFISFLLQALPLNGSGTEAANVAAAGSRSRTRAAAKMMVRCGLYCPRTYTLLA